MNDSEFAAECEKLGIRLFGIVFEVQGWEFPAVFDENGKLILDCRICPYNRISPCIGYCIAALRREVAVAYGDRQGSA